MCHNPLARVACNILLNTEIAPNIYDMVIEVGDMAVLAKPGQFVNLYCANQSRLLPRPISICQVDMVSKTLRLIYAAVGEGTKEFATLKPNDTIEVLGPLGTGFTMEGHENKEILVVGGGVGTPPLLQLVKSLKNTYGESIRITTVLGFRDDIYLSEEFKAYGAVYLATDSGKYGFKGNVIELMKETFKEKLIGNQSNFDYMFSCGPTPMLRGLQQFNTDYEIPGEFSLEERMGCGFGGCVGCVVGIRSKETSLEGSTIIACGDDGKGLNGLDAGESFEYKKVCKDGPVFEYSEVIF